MENSKMSLCFIYGIMLSLSLNFLWFTNCSARIRYSGSKELESVVDIPLLTPTSNTEPILMKDFESREVTSAAIDVDIYEQISPSRDPTTPISRKFFDKHHHGKFESAPSTIPTILSAPPPFYYTS